MTHAKLIQALQRTIDHSTVQYHLYRSNHNGRARYTVYISDDRYGSAQVEDITDDLSAAQRFLVLLHTEAVEPCHLQAVAEDSLPLK